MKDAKHQLGLGRPSNFSLSCFPLRLPSTNIAKHILTHQEQNEKKTKRVLPFEQSSSHMEAPVSPVSSSRCLIQAQEARANC